MMRTALPLLAAVPFCTATAIADLIEFTVDPAQSSVGLQLCVNVFGSQCGDDSSDAGGTVLADVDVTPRVAEITILDINVDALDDLSVNINLGLGGSVQTDSVGLGVRYAGPPQGTGPFTVDAGGGFTITGLTTSAVGQTSYTLNGLACALAGGTPCQDSVDLGAQPAQTLEPFGATITSDGSTYTLTLEVQITAPLLDTDPGLAVGTVTGVLVATAPVPVLCPEDVDGSGGVDLADLLAVLADFGTMTSAPSDVDGSGAVDLTDLLAVLAAFGTACP